MTNKNTLITVILIVVLAVLGYFFFFNNSSLNAENGNPTSSQQKINIDQVCKDALIYMTFTDSVAADLFVKECKEGKHPQVIEDYKIRMGLGAGATI